MAELTSQLFDKKVTSDQSADNACACAGVSVHFGASSAISTDGQIISVGTAAFANQLNKFTYLYK
jgi:hypothetical protein